jgi:hypothetical protein
MSGSKKKKRGLEKEEAGKRPFSPREGDPDSEPHHQGFFSPSVPFSEAASYPSHHVFCPQECRESVRWRDER